MKTLKQQRGAFDISGIESLSKPKDKNASSVPPKLPISIEHTKKFDPLPAMLKTFVVWFFLGAGLLFSGFWCIVAMQEIAGSNPGIAIAVFVVGGGIFTGLLAIAISRLSQPHVLPSGVVLQGEALLEHASRLGISLKHLYDSNGNLQEPDLQRRVLDVEKAIRERWFLAVAVGAAVFSGLSALAAWLAHLK